jgi:hypothetical protein
LRIRLRRSGGIAFTLLHLTFGLLQECAFLPREHIIGIDSFLRLDDYRTPMLLNRHEVLVLYRERSGEKNFGSSRIVRPERFRYSDLKEAVVESSSYVF